MKTLACTHFSFFLSLLKNVSYSKTMPFAQIFSNIYQLAHTIVVARKPEIYGAGQQSGNSDRSQCCYLQAENFLQEMPLLLFLTSTDWVRPTHIMKGNFKSPDNRC